jgi:nanoRNase/pAp phosphatase (c-di-AMP/oligoRNAs hydrolase)
MEDVKADLDLRELMELHQGECHLVILPHFPNPDAIAAAYTHRLIGLENNIDSQVIYSGRIRPRQNVALVKLLGMELIAFPDDLDLSRYQGAVVIGNLSDVSSELLERVEEAGIPRLAAINELSSAAARNSSSDTKVRPSAISVLYTQLVQDGLIELKKSRKEHVAAATALLYAIMSETEHFVLANEADLEAASFLSTLRDAELLEYIVSQVRSKQVMEIIRRALGDRIIAENYSIAGIGYLRAEDREAVAHAAEFLLSEENVHTAIVYGIVRADGQEEALVGSVRTSKVTILPEEFIEDLFRKFFKDEDCGDLQLLEDGFHIPVGFLSGFDNPRYQEMKWQVFDAQVKQIIFDKIGVQQEIFTD